MSSSMKQKTNGNAGMTHHGRWCGATCTLPVARALHRISPATLMCYSYPISTL